MKTISAALRAWAALRLWAIRPGTLDAYLATATQRFASGFPGQGGGGEPSEPAGPTVRVLDGVAMVPVSGPLIEGPTPCEREIMGLFGGTAYDDIRAMLGAAAASPEVRAIFLDINSPGGTAVGMDQTAAAIRAASAIKPTVAFVQGWAASAAYGLAVSAPRIVASGESAEVGSIGSVITYMDNRRALKDAGIDVYEFVSANAPNKRPDPATEAGKQEIQRQVDDAEAIFLDIVARGRNVSTAKVLDDFGQGGMLFASEALSVGMIDAVQARPATLASLIEQGKAASLARPVSPSVQPYRPAARAAVPRPSRPAAAARGG
jgi:ClpP class serine protease